MRMLVCVCVLVCVCLPTLLSCGCSDVGYWVSKASLRVWRVLALEQLDEDEEETRHSNGKTNGEGPDISAMKGNQACEVIPPLPLGG